MLFDLNGNEVKRLPHREQFEAWRNRISDEDYERAVEAIKMLIHDKGEFNSSFLPGSDWTGTAFEPLYEACGRNVTHAGYFFGLIVWSVVMEDEDAWVFKPSDKGEGDPLGTFYWRIDR